VDDTCIYATEKHERRALCKLQRGLTTVNSWCERWNSKIREGKIQAIYFSERFRVPVDVLQLTLRDIPFVNNVTYLGVTFDRRMTWRHHIERAVAKALRTYISIHFLLKICLQVQLLKLHFTMLYVGQLCLSNLGICGGCSPLETAAPAERSTLRYWKS
jgi:hypothetical protein